MTKQVEACCSSPASLCYWFTISLIAWGVLSLVGIYWPLLRASSAAACLFAMAVGCLANWFRNHTFHCAITGPLFLIAGVVFLLSGERMIHVNTSWAWTTLVLIGVGIALLLEWRYAKRSASSR
jgi:signal transduction histidine kinase